MRRYNFSFNCYSKLLIIYFCFVASVEAGGTLATEAPADKAAGIVVESLIEAVVNQHPSVLLEKSNKAATEIDIDIANKQFYPKVEVQSGYTQTNSSSSSQFGSVLALEQPLWTFGKLQAGLESAKATDAAQTYRVEEVRYDLALQVIDAWQNLVFAEEKIKQLTITQKKLNDYLLMMQRRIDARISPKIEMTLLGARVAQVNDDMRQTNTLKGISLSKLEWLTGDKRESKAFVDELPLNNLYIKLLALMESDVNGELGSTINKHPSVLKALQQVEQLKQQLNIKKAEQYPEIYARAQTAIYGSNLNDGSSIYLGLRYQSGNGFSTLDAQKSSAARLMGQTQNVEAVKREVGQSIEIENENMQNAVYRESSLSKATNDTQEVFSSYERQFAAGRRTWLDLLNAVRENSDNRVALINARVSAIGSLYKIKIRMSKLGWQQLNGQGV